MTRAAGCAMLSRPTRPFPLREPCRPMRSYARAASVTRHPSCPASYQAVGRESAAHPADRVVGRESNAYPAGRVIGAATVREVACLAPAVGIDCAVTDARIAARRQSDGGCRAGKRSVSRRLAPSIDLNNSIGGMCAAFPPYGTYGTLQRKGQ